MAERHELIYPVEPWRVSQDRIDFPSTPDTETVFALANGYMGIRGSLEEQSEFSRPGSFINGYYETEPIIYGEWAYGYATHRQRMVPLGDPTIIRLTVNGTPLDADALAVRDFRRTLDMQTGMLEREMLFIGPNGEVVHLSTSRLASFRRQHILAIHWVLTMKEGSADLHIDSVLRGRPAARNNGHDPRLGGDFSREALMLGKRDADERIATVRYRTRNSGFDVIGAVANVIETDANYERSLEANREEVGHSFDLKIGPGQSVAITKYAAFYTSQDYPRKRLTGLVRREVEAARRSGFNGLSVEQKSYLEAFWNRSDLQIEGDDALQQSIRFNVFHLLQAAGRNGRTSVAAKGLTGPGYEGHYFWDTEIYVMPFLTYTNPGIARAILEYRYRTLNRARARAKTLHHEGALYPWRTINGDEASAYFPAGTAQYHINADVIYAMRKYVRATGDRWFLLKRGAEMLFETARFWADLGSFIDGKGFCINEVTGPDEYTALVNNNTFTNLMASDHLQYAVDVFREMQEKDEAMLNPLVDRINLDEAEVEGWKRCADEIYIPYDERRGIHPQDDAFFDRERWDFENTPPERYPLLLHYHPLTIYRYQVLKQPDLVLAIFLQGDRFTEEQKRRNFEFYDPLTTGDSSLAPCIQSIVAAEIGETELAYRYFMRTARMDLDNVNGNVADGVHTAAMAGTWLSMVYGFAGMRDYAGELSFRPALPREWKRVTFRILFRGTLLEITIGARETTYRLPHGGEIGFSHGQEFVSLSGTESVQMSNPRA